MSRRRLLVKEGFTLIELSVAMAAMIILSTSVIPVAIRSIEIKAAEKTVVEVAILHEAARDYYVKHANLWPPDLLTLRALGYVNPQWDLKNPWGDSYQIVNNVHSLSVVTKIPSYLTGVLKMRLPQVSVDGEFVTSVIAEASDNALPSGVIVAWKGAIANIPVGWALCDGTNGTPDLRDKFVVGARQDDADGLAKTLITGALTREGRPDGSTEGHVLTIAEIPSHQHESWGEAFAELAPWGVGSGGRGHLGASNSDRDNYHYLTSPVGGNSGHSHAIKNAQIIPSYYALAFIMKVSVSAPRSEIVK